MTQTDAVRRDPLADAEVAARDVAAATGVTRHDIGFVFGSGFSEIAGDLGKASGSVPMDMVHGFFAPTIKGHPGEIRSIVAGDNNVLGFLGRTHLYEDLGINAAVHNVRTACAAGCRTMIFTSAVGSLRQELADGTAMLTRGHISFFIPSPLAGLPGLHFLQPKEWYSTRLRDLCRANGLELPEGVLVQLVGPHFEMDVEREALRVLGADTVGLSSVEGAIAALDLGMEVLGITVITDLAGTPVGHDDVLAVVRKTAKVLAPNLARVLTLV
ncbi:MAG: purine-nucleoside phosphorylase [Candidatus Kerfeldbacteria bacterium]